MLEHDHRRSWLDGKFSLLMFMMEQASGIDVPSAGSSLSRAACGSQYLLRPWLRSASIWRSRCCRLLFQLVSMPPSQRWSNETGDGAFLVT